MSSSSYPLFTRFGVTALAVSFVFSTPLSAFAAEVEVSGWIPYWRTEAGTADARAHINQFTEVNPFGYTVKSDGSLNDVMNYDQSAWQKLARESRSKSVRVVPTLMWSDTNAIHSVLSDKKKRQKHIREIVEMVKDTGVDGVDIDYEGKKAETRDSYSLFLKELSAELKAQKSPKWLQCTIEARMPLEARYSGTPPANIEYANDLPKINRYCDRVRVMTYDQQTADVQLNKKYAKQLYAPVSDVQWVEKVVNYMDNDIDRSKMAIGIPTYGYIWQAMPKPDGSGYTYIKTESFNPRYGVETAKEYDITPERGPSGELSFSYVPKDNPDSLPSQEELSRRAPKNTPSAWLAAAGALALAKEKRQQAPLTFLTWSDAGAIKQKVDLAKRMGVAGVAIFKIDGGEDSGMWNALPDTAPKLTKAPKGSTTPTEDPVTEPTPTPPQTSVRFTMDLSYGSENSEVLALQKILVAKGYLKATPNGYFGPATLAAVRAWQTANKLPSTGTIGPLSRGILNAL
jgi:spore germination protein YaaH